MENKCKIATVIIICFLLIVAISGLVIYFINSMNRHDERCIIRYLYDRDMLRDVRFEDSPLTISFDGCEDAIIKGRRHARDDIKIPCNLHDNKEFITELDDLGMLSRIYQRIRDVERANAIKREIGKRIQEKCDGMLAQLDNRKYVA